MFKHDHNILEEEESHMNYGDIITDNTSKSNTDDENAENDAAESEDEEIPENQCHLCMKQLSCES